MKKNKTLTAVLLVMVVGIWGVIIFRLVNHFQTSDDFVINDNYTLPPIADKTQQKESFELLLNYSDPFTKGGSKRSSISSESAAPKSGKPSKSENEQSEIAVASKINIIYRGYSVDERQQITRVRIDINGASHTMKLHQDIEGVKLIAMHKDSIVLKSDGAIWSVKRKK